MPNPLYGLIYGFETLPLERCENGRLLLFDTEKEAYEWGKAAHVNFHVVPVDLETALRKNGELSALATVRLGHSIDRCASAIADCLAGRTQAAGVFPDWMLKRWARAGGIYPFEEANVNTASVDLRIGNAFVDLTTGVHFEADAIEIKPGDAILATTVEYIQMPPDAIGVVYLKSSLARQGLDHALAGFVDCSFCGELTMELHSHRPITLRAGQRVIQLVLSETKGLPDNPYQGRYQGQRGPTPAREEDEG